MKHVFRNSCSCRTAIRLLASGAVMSGLAAGCMGNDAVDVVVYDPTDLRWAAQYAQLAIFAETCPSDYVIATGMIKGAVAVQTIAADGQFASVGELKKQKYGFVALLRGSDCSVIGAGCTPVDLEKHRHITVQIDPVVPPAGACDASLGQKCVGGICSN
jgi:hypothetical protein